MPTSKNPRDVQSNQEQMQILGILAAIYAVEQPREAWLTGILHAFTPLCERGAGGILYDITAADRLHVDFLTGVDMPSILVEMGVEAHRNPEMVPFIIGRYRSKLLLPLREQARTQREEKALRQQFRVHQVADDITINGVDSSGKGCALHLFSGTEKQLTSFQKEIYTQLATHLATAYRLQRRLAAQEKSGSTDVEAVLTPSGKVDHAEAGARSTHARESLARAVLQRESARDGKSHSHAEPSTAHVMKSMKGLVTARWTLVDHYESGGRRYVLARENAPRPTGPASLSDREQQVVSLAALGRTNKIIAYELGLAHSTVRVLIARACQKLGVRKRSHLIARQQAAATW